MYLLLQHLFIALSAPFAAKLVAIIITVTTWIALTVSFLVNWKT